MQKDKFDFLINSDKNLQYQQNISKYSIRFIILNVPENNYETVLSSIEKIKKVLQNKDKPNLTILVNEVI